MLQKITIPTLDIGINIFTGNDPELLSACALIAASRFFHNPGGSVSYVDVSLPNFSAPPESPKEAIAKRSEAFGFSVRGMLDSEECRH
jgi:hypothetical protein